MRLVRLIPRRALGPRLRLRWRDLRVKLGVVEDPRLALVLEKDLVMMPDLRPVPRRLDAAIHLIGPVSLNLDLHRRVVDFVVMRQFLDDGFEDLLSLTDALLGDENVTTARNRAGANRPDVQIMHAQHARY